MRSIVLTGGGTAGHVLPNIALLPYLQQHFDKIYYLGGGGMEKEIAAKNNLEYYEITTVKLKRKLTLENLLIPFKLLKGIGEAKKILRKLQPSVIFSKGGFVALPVVYAAASLGIKVVAHESDMSMGLANRLTAKKCRTICTTFPLAKTKYPQVVQTGAIIRRNIYQGDKSKIALPANGKPNLLIMGGSLGSVAINQAVWNALDQLCARYNVLHLTGKGKARKNLRKEHYLQIEYLESPQHAFAWADIVVARAGSGTVCELLALKKPAIYIPLPKAESRGDQIQNAAYLHSLGVCEVIDQATLDDAVLLKTLDAVYQKRKEMVENCARQTWVDGTNKIVNYLRWNWCHRFGRWSFRKQFG